MTRSYFHDFTRNDGSPVTVEYEIEGSYSPTTYSPHSGADGGDAPTFTIIGCWPNTPEYDALTDERAKIINPTTQWRPRDPLLMQPEERERIAELDDLIADADRACALTDAERERMEDWLAEHYFELHHHDDDLEF